MKPLHSSLARLNRCPCCHSKYSRDGKRTNYGKTAARMKAKKELKNVLRGDSD
jgi:hypothetical protein